MRPVYIRRDEKDFTRKIMTDMPYLSTYKKLRIPGHLFEEGLYIIFNEAGTVKKYYLSEDKIIKKDKHYYYFKFPFKAFQVEDLS